MTDEQKPVVVKTGVDWSDMGCGLCIALFGLWAFSGTIIRIIEEIKR